MRDSRVMRSGWNKLKVKRTQGGLVRHLLRAHMALRSRPMQPRVTLISDHRSIGPSDTTSENTGREQSH
ncbi:hypothetical protein IG631_13024 [Alternaria alternata]|nr:hypothetical protein IG631_13024 [Alternaria alternata]